jgi:hypothetical protein
LPDLVLTELEAAESEKQKNFLSAFSQDPPSLSQINQDPPSLSQISSTQDPNINKPSYINKKGEIVYRRKPGPKPKHGPALSLE